MATVIRRSNEYGDPRLLRIPMTEPGPAPMSRVSALSFQGDNGELVNRLVDAGTVAGDYVPGTGMPAPYRIMDDGVPGIRFDMPIAANPYGSPALYRAATGVPRTFIIVTKFDRLPFNPGTGSLTYAQMMRADFSGNFGLSVRSTAASSNPGRIVGTMGAGNGFIYGPEMPADGQLHFFALVYSGQTVRLYFDNVVGEVTAANPITPGSLGLVGYDASGADYTIVEAAQYSTALTPAQIADKRAFHRAFYQFN